MRKLMFLVAVVLVVGVSARAQHPRVEIFGGYSYARLGQDGFSTRLSGSENANGWGASVSLNANRFFGFTADVAGQFGRGTVLVSQSPPADFSSHQFLFGPRFTARGAGATLFAHVLLGVVRNRLSSFSSSGTTFPARTSTDFALAAGGGLDVKLSPLLALRAFQVDYIPVHQGGFINQDFAQNIRVQTGIVLRY